MTETLCGYFIDALNAAGIPAFSEYPQILKPMPAVPFFVTVACTAADFDRILNSFFGDAAPAAMTLRLRLHCRTDALFSEYADKTDACILDTVHEKMLDLRKIRFGELHYVRQLDRLVRETLLDITGTAYLINENKEGAHSQ